MSEFVSIEPATGAELWRGSAGNVDAAVRQARQAWPGWARMALTERIGTVRSFITRMRQDSENLTDLVARETGRTLWDVREEIETTIAQCDVSVRALADRAAQRRIEPRSGYRGALRHKPLGTAAVITSFSDPVQTACGHILPALLAGNAIVYKPSSLTPATGQRLADYFAEADLPTGLVTLVQGNPDTGQELALHGGINAVLFTGSSYNGIALNRQLAARPDRLVSLDMAGNNPLIAWDIDDIHSAAVLIVQSAFHGAGQKCTAARRLIVQRDLYGQLMAEILRITDRLIVDAPHADPPPFMGPVIDNDTADGITESFLTLMCHGGQPLRHMRRPYIHLPFLTPGIIDVTDMSERPDIELFGPLLQVIQVDQFHQAIAEANRTRFGLCAALIGGTEEQYERFWASSRCGIVNWNAPTHEISVQAPFGGVGLSGNHRPGGYYAADRTAYPVASTEAHAPRGMINIGLKDEEYSFALSA